MPYVADRQLDGDPATIGVIGESVKGVLYRLDSFLVPARQGNHLAKALDRSVVREPETQCGTEVVRKGGEIPAVGCREIFTHPVPHLSATVGSVVGLVVIVSSVNGPAW